MKQKQIYQLLLAGFWIFGACQAQPKQASKAEQEPAPKVYVKTTDKISESDKKIMDSINVLESKLQPSLLQILGSSKRGEALKIVCYGNSITNGYKVGSWERVDAPYPETLAKLMQKNWNNQKIIVQNEGHNGWRSDQALANLKRLVLNKNPQVVTLMFGINDAYSNFSEALYLQKMQAIVRQLKAQNITVILLSPTFINTPYQARVRQFAYKLSDLARSEAISFVDVGGKLAKKAFEAKIKPKDLLPDDVHLADQYYAWIADIIFGEVQAE